MSFSTIVLFLISYSVIENSTWEIHEELEDNLILVHILLIILTLGVGLYGVNKIVQPIVKLTNTFDDISKGNFETEIYQKNHVDEISNLSESVNRIIRTMKLAAIKNRRDKFKKDFKKS